MKKLLIILFLFIFPIIANAQGGFIGNGMVGGENPNFYGNKTVNATLGSELITWTAAGWDEDAATWTFAGGVLTHVTGNTTTVTGTITGALTVGRTVRVAIVGTGGVATATYTLGGNTGTTIAASGAIAIVDFLTTTGDSELVITPANTCIVAITSISVKELTDATGDLTVDGNLTVRSPFTLPILLPNGTNVLPSFSFGSDPDTGIYRISENNIGFTNGGIQYISINSSGDLIVYDKIRSSTYSITAGSGTGITVNNTGNVNSLLYKVTTTYSAYTDTDTTKGIVIATLPVKTKIVGFYADVTTAFKGGAVNAATLEVGITAEGAAEILAAKDCWTAAATYGLADADMGTGMTRAAQIQGGYLPSWSGTTDIYATIDTTAGNLNALTQGSVTFYIETERF